MTETLLLPNEDYLRQPRKPFDPAEFGLHPDDSEGDKWLVNASLGDELLMLLYRQKEERARLHVTGEEGGDYKQMMRLDSERIEKRRKFLEDQS